MHLCELVENRNECQNAKAEKEERERDRNGASKKKTYIEKLKSNKSI